MAQFQSPTSLLLTKEVAINAIQDFFRGDKPFVVFGSGMSCAIDPKFGMPALACELIQRICPDPCNDEQTKQWKKVLQSLQDGCGLETALNSVTDPDLLQKVILVTGYFVARLDRRYALKIAKRDEYVEWPATTLFKRLVETLPEGDPILHVLTTNYDTLFEHICDAIKLSYTNGYVGGLKRRLDWIATDRLLKSPQQNQYGRRVRTVPKSTKHIRLYKVHGSLNLFFYRNEVIENNTWMWHAPGFADRVMITPGISKHQALQHYRQELLQYADSAIENANRFLFLGYGFNDSHLEEYIKRKLTVSACKGLIITRDSNSRIESLVEQADNLWLVCKMPQEGEGGTRIFNRQYADWLILPEYKLWDIETFTAEILGG